MIKIDTTNVDRAAERWQRRAKRLDTDARESVQTLGAPLTDAARGVTPADTGALAASWEYQATREGAVLRNRQRYAGFVLAGRLAAEVKAAARPHLKTIKSDLIRRIERGS